MRKLAAILVPLLLLACREQPATAPAAAPPTPAFDFSNGPAQPGNSYILRDAYGGFAWYFIDSVTDLAALVSDQPCGAFADTTPVPTQVIFSPSDTGLTMYLENGMINAMVLAPPYGCDDVLATGRVKNSWHDNDVYAWLFDHDRANAWGGGVNGRVGRYKVLCRLGAGAFGDVYKGHDPELDRPVALKVPRAGTMDDPNKVERFLREARAAAKLSHPNIVTVYDAGRDGERPFIASAFVDVGWAPRAAFSGSCVPFPFSIERRVLG